MTNIFISHPSSFNKEQANFLVLLEDKFKTNGLNPVNLGKSNWNYTNPLKPIKKIMRDCKGAVIIGLERFHSYIGYEFENSEKSKEFIHRRDSTPWIHIEAGMAYQKGLLLLILREENVHASGIPDPISSEYFIFEFNILEQQDKLSANLDAYIDSWVKDVLGK